MSASPSSSPFTPLAKASSGASLPVVCFLLLLTLISATEITRAQSFSDPMTYSVNENPNSGTSGDFNGDSKPDLVTANALGNDVSVLLNTGDGTFNNAVNYGVGFLPQSIVTGDFNSDSKLDLAVGNFFGGFTSTGTISILIGNGNGTFQTKVDYAASSPSSLQAVDLNADGKLDLAVASFMINSASVLLGNGDGTFQPATTYPAGTEPLGISVADFNADGKPDLAITNLSSNNVSILLGNGNGTFQSALNSATPSRPTGIAARDFNGDAKQDLVVADVDADAILVFLGLGNGSFQPPVSYAVGSKPQELELADFNGDGRKDVVVVNALGNSTSLLRGNSDGTFQPAVTRLGRQGSVTPVVSDFDTDGKPDLAVMSNSLDVVDVQFNSPSARSVAISATAAAPATGVLVATFKDYDLTKTAASFTATINWGDATTPTSGTVAANGSGGFNVTGTHTYAKEGSYSVNVQIADASGNSAAATSTATVADAPLTATPKTINAIENTAFTAVVASFTDADPTGNVGEFSATINWGDGANSAGTVTANGSGGFNVSGSHTYSNSGSFPVVVMILAVGGSTATANSTANVSDGGALQFSSATFASAEDGGNAVITVTRTGGSAGEARVNYAASNGTATEGQDYTSAFGTLIFPDGVTTSQTFNVAITNDAFDEPDETINLTLTSPAGSGSLGTPASAVLTINDNDPTPGISIDDVSTTEGDSGTVNAIFTVSLSSQSGQTVTVSFATANGTATAGSDYQASSGTVTFLPLETTKPVTVTINGDVSFEPSETFFVNLSTPVNATVSDNQGLGTILNDDAQGGIISFSQSNYAVGESGGFATITVNRTNDLSGPATVAYATSDDSGTTTVVPCSTVNSIASSRCDFTTALGTLRFAAGESSKTFLVLISQDNYVEGPEALTLTLSNLTGGAAFATPSTATLTITDDATEPTANPIDSANAFVLQHYHDFLNREPDAAGLAFWSNQITECQQPGATCDAAVRRVNVSAAFFLSIEFQETGYLVYRMYKAGYGNITGTPVPVRFTEFLPDTQQIGQGVVVGVGDWQAQLENNKLAYAQDFVSRSRFTAAYLTTLTPAEFVDALFTNAGVTPSAAARDAAINEFGIAGNTADTAARARALRRVAEHSTLGQQEFNRAFVLMEYFGYLRRNPNDAPEPGLNFGGYTFWLNKLNEFSGNYITAEMVKAFITAGEYRQRFGP